MWSGPSQQVQVPPEDNRIDAENTSAAVSAVPVIIMHDNIEKNMTKPNLSHETAPSGRDVKDWRHLHGPSPFEKGLP